MAKSGKYETPTPDKNKRKPSNGKKTTQNKNNAKKKTGTKSKPQSAQNSSSNIKKNDELKLNQSTREAKTTTHPQKITIPDDDVTMNTIGLSVEEIIREINIENSIERPSPTAYVHQSDGSATANAVEYKNPLRQRQKAEQEAAATVANTETVADTIPSDMPELVRPTIPTKESIQQKRQKPPQNKTKHTSTTKKKSKHKNKKPKERKEPSPLLAVYDSDYSIKQAERDGTIAGLYCLGFIAILAGAYALLSNWFPQISVNAMADKLIEWVFMAVVGEGPIIAVLDVLMAVVGRIAEWVVGWSIW